MKTNERRTAGLPRATIVALLLAVFTVSVGYSVVLPLLPDLIQRLLRGGTSPQLVSRHTGLLTGMYALAVFLAAPAWGRLSDAHGRRNALVAALMGFSVATAVFSLVESIAAIYLQRLLSGAFAAAAMPVAWATIAELTTSDEQRGRRLAYVSMASIAGFMIGPTLGVFVTRLGPDLLSITSPGGSITVPLASMASLAAVVGIVVALTVPNGSTPEMSETASVAPAATRRPVIMRLLALTFIVSAGLGVFEVGLALRGTQELSLTSYQIALMFTECSLVMFVAQAFVFSPWLKADTTRWFVTPALVALMASLIFVPRASSFWLMLVATGGVAASVGVLSPVLTYWVSTRAGMAQGRQLGKQAAAASLGVTTGSAAGGLLFNVGGARGASFTLTAGLVAAGLFLSLTLPRALAPDDARHRTHRNDPPH